VRPDFRGSEIGSLVGNGDALPDLRLLWDTCPSLA